MAADCDFIAAPDSNPGIICRSLWRLLCCPGLVWQWLQQEWTSPTHGTCARCFSSGHLHNAMKYGKPCPLYHHHCHHHHHHHLWNVSCAWSISLGDDAQCCGVYHHQYPHHCQHLIILCAWSFSLGHGAQCCGVYHHQYHHHCQHLIILCAWSFSLGHGVQCCGVCCHHRHCHCYCHIVCLVFQLWRWSTMLWSMSSSSWLLLS